VQLKLEALGGEPPKPEAPRTSGSAAAPAKK
jgi:hypothetical protein